MVVNKEAGSVARVDVDDVSRAVLVRSGRLNMMRGGLGRGGHGGALIYATALRGEGH